MRDRGGTSFRRVVGAAAVAATATIYGLVDMTDNLLLLQYSNNNIRIIISVIRWAVRQLIVRGRRAEMVEEKKRARSVRTPPAARGNGAFGVPVTLRASANVWKVRRRPCGCLFTQYTAAEMRTRAKKK